jgi:hypothetical protein
MQVEKSVVSLTPEQLQQQPASVVRLAGSVIALAQQNVRGGNVTPSRPHHSPPPQTTDGGGGVEGEEVRDVFVTTTGEGRDGGPAQQHHQHPPAEVHVLRWAESVLLDATTTPQASDPHVVGAEVEADNALAKLSERERFLRDPLCACLFDGYELHALSEHERHARYELFAQRIQALPVPVAKSRIVPWLLSPGHFAQTAASVFFAYVFSDDATAVVSADERKRFSLLVLGLKDSTVRIASLRFLPQMMPLLPVGYLGGELLADFCHAVFDSDTLLAMNHIKAFRTVLVPLLARCQRGEGGSDDLTEESLVKKYNTQILPILFRVATDPLTAPELRGVALANMVALWDWHVRVHRSVVFTAVLKCIYDPTPAVRETSLALLHGIVHERNSLFTRSELAQLLIPAVTPLAIDPEPGVRAHAATLSILLYRGSVETAAVEEGRALLPSVSQYTFGSYPQHSRDPAPARQRMFTVTPASMVMPQQGI